MAQAHCSQSPGKPAGLLYISNNRQHSSHLRKGFKTFPGHAQPVQQDGEFAGDGDNHSFGRIPRSLRFAQTPLAQRRILAEPPST